MSLIVSDIQKGQPIPLPKRIDRLTELAHNLWWSWNEDARQLFRSLDYANWRISRHNPVKELRDMSQDTIETAARDPAFLTLYDSVMSKYDIYMAGENTWFKRQYAGKPNGGIAYFSAEYAIHSSLPIYAGGLGALAGDLCKEASDLGLPFSAVGFMYPQGYFHQTISAEGWQQETYTTLNFDEAPISLCTDQVGDILKVKVYLAGRDLYLKVWKVKIGRVNLYLLDPNIDENTPADRNLAARLYIADPEDRMRQLIVLGIGGVRALRAQGIEPSVWHANEDHTALMMLQRVREEILNDLSVDAAVKKIRSSTLFTTHTPVPAGNNVFDARLAESYGSSFWGPLGVEKEAFMNLARYSGQNSDVVNLTAMALRLSSQANAVSLIHAKVARKMWQVLWPDRTEETVPITHVTNGVHLPTWQAPEIRQLCQKYTATNILEAQDDPNVWKGIMEIPDEEFWRVRQSLKTNLIRLIQDQAQQRWMEGTANSQQVAAMGSLFDPYALTIAFTRRFTEYKRPSLILSDIERLKRIINNPLRPVQIIFAGKSHPADFASKNLINQVYLFTLNRTLQGRVAFVEDYDLHLARELVRGVDVWLNTPRRKQEACGTSGMKASMNGVINLSVPDGWWNEGYNGENGWSINGTESRSPEEEDHADAEALYQLLENKVVPLYYERDRNGVPHQWIQIAKEAIWSVSPKFSACRMVKDYTRQMYEKIWLAGSVNSL